MNNNDNLDKFISDIESIKMTTQEKSEMRTQLASFAVQYTPVVSPYHHITLMMRRSLAIAFVAVISIGSLSNIASGAALPGDTLYPVKIAHEEIKLATTLSTKKKVSYEIRRTEKRIQEATELATQYELDSEKQTEIAEKIKKQTTKVKKHIEEVKEKSPEEALVLNAELKSTIKVNAEALKRVSTTKTTQKKVDPETEVEPVNLEVEKLSDEDTTTENEDIVENESTTENQDSSDNQVENTEESDGEYVTVEVSFAENLLDSIEEEVKGIEAFEEEVSEEIVKGENEEDTAEEEPVEEVTELNVEKIEKEIRSLEDIIELKNEINERKSEIGIEATILTDEINETSIYREVDQLIKERKYKKAFVLLQELLSYLNEERISDEIHLDLGIDLVVEEEPSEEGEEIASEPNPSGNQRVNLLADESREEITE